MSERHDHEETPEHRAVHEALDRLNQAIQDFNNARNAEAGQPASMVAEAVVVWEEMLFDADGKDARAVNWTIPSQHFSLATAIGLLDLGAAYIKRDLIPQRVTDGE